MRRVAAIMLLALFAIGPAVLQAIHERSVQQQWQAQIVRLAIFKKSTSQLPAPKHDASQCVVCNLLHSPALSRTFTPQIAAATTPIEFAIEFSRVVAVRSIVQSDFCRGPPQMPA